MARIISLYPTIQYPLEVGILRRNWYIRLPRGLILGWTSAPTSLKSFRFIDLNDPSSSNFILSQFLKRQNLHVIKRIQATTRYHNKFIKYRDILETYNKRVLPLNGEQKPKIL